MRRISRRCSPTCSTTRCATRPSGGRIDVAVADEAGAAVLSVTDTGPGIPAPRASACSSASTASPARTTRRWHRAAASDCRSSGASPSAHGATVDARLRRRGQGPRRARALSAMTARTSLKAPLSKHPYIASCRPGPSGPFSIGEHDATQESYLRLDRRRHRRRPGDGLHALRCLGGCERAGGDASRAVVRRGEARPRPRRIFPTSRRWSIAPARPSSTSARSTPQGQGPVDLDDIDEDSPYYEFFKRFGGVPNGPGMRPQQPTRGLGSGFIVSPDGYIVTNAHVVDGASEVVVKLTDRREFTAKVVGTDKRTDIALVKIDAKNLPALDLAAKPAVKRGEWVIAIGSPFGFENSVSAGVVSGVHRALPDGQMVPFIQTDVAVNPGNSGGPLLNAAGTGRRRQLADLQPFGRLHGTVVRHSGGRRGEGRRSAEDARQGRARTSRHRHPGARPVARAELRSARLQRRARRPGREGQPCGQGRLQVGRRDPQDRRRRGRRQHRCHEPDRQHGARAPRSTSKYGARARRSSSRRRSARSTTARSRRSATKPTPKGKLGIAVRPRTAEEQKAGDKSGLVVEQSGGAAAKAGVQAGDVILGVGSSPVNYRRRAAHRGRQGRQDGRAPDRAPGPPDLRAGQAVLIRVCSLRPSGCLKAAAGRASFLCADSACTQAAAATFNASTRISSVRRALSAENSGVVFTV